MNTRCLPSLLAVASVVALVSLAAGCTSDRFNDAGCASDSECRVGRLCYEGTCLDPSVAHHYMSPDAGSDTDTDATPAVDVGNGTDGGDASTTSDVTAFIGMWDMRVSGTVNPDGQDPQNVDNQQVMVNISRGTGSTLLIDIQGADSFCTVHAQVSRPGHFVLLDQPCTSSQNGSTARYSNISGTGILSDQGVLTFEYDAILNVSQANDPSGSNMTARFNLTFRGQRAVAMD